MKGSSGQFSLLLQWGAADAEIKIPSGENTELKRSPSKAWSRSLYSHTCYAYSQRFFPCFFLLFRSIHLHFFKNLYRVFPLLTVVNTASYVGLRNKLAHPAGCRFPCWVPTEKKHDLLYDDLSNEWLGDSVKFVFCPDRILCGWLGSKRQLTN